MNILVTLVDGEQKEFSNIATFNSGVLDGEAMQIISDRVLSEFHIDDVPSVIKLLITKCHKGSYLKFVELDISRVAREILKDKSNVGSLNQSLTSEKNRCFLTCQYLEGMVREVSPSDFWLSGMSYSSNQFSITFHRRDN